MINFNWGTLSIYRKLKEGGEYHLGSLLTCVDITNLDNNDLIVRAKRVA